MITGAHVIIDSEDVAADRAFMRDVFGFDSVDVGGGWLIFALPPAEVAFHSGDNGRHQLYLMSADLDATLDELKEKGVTPSGALTDESWGRLASIRLPGGGELAVYQPKHASPPHHR